MTFKEEYKEAFVWTWLPKEIQPIVASRLAPDGDNLVFNYGRIYKERVKDTVSIYEPELPYLLESGSDWSP